MINFVIRMAVSLTLMTAFLGARAASGQDRISDDPDAKITVRISAEKQRLRPGENVVLHVEIWNEGENNLFIFKEFKDPDNPLSTLEMTLYNGTKPDIPEIRTIAVDTPAFLLKADSSLASALSIGCVALAPHHFYGGEVVMNTTLFRRLRIPGKYRIQGRYWSRGFLAEDINNPLLGYAEELKKLPYRSWTGNVETNSIWIEVAKPTVKKQ
jgi:hypothetical protein